MLEVKNMQELDRRDLTIDGFIAELCEKNPGKEPYITEGRRLNHVIYRGGDPHHLVPPDGYLWVDNPYGERECGFSNAKLHAEMGLRYQIFFEVTAV